jgi:hypothetical protein
VSGSQEVHHKREWRKGGVGKKKRRVYKGGAANPDREREREREREKTELNQIKSDKTSPKSVCANSSTQEKKNN